MSDNKVKIIQDWLEPKKVKYIQSFLGFANFYHQFIFNYSDIVILLTYLTWKDISWKFDSFCHNTFNSLKKAFTSAPILTYWIPNAQLIVETDALDYALATILSIVDKDNKVHPVAFHFHTFTVVELNYNTHDKELLAIFEAFKILRHYLEGPAYLINIVMDLSQTSFSLYLHNQWTNFHKLSCAGKPQMRAIHTYVECTKATTNDQDIRLSVAVKALSANISWTAERICMIKLALESAYQSVSNNIWYVSKQ